MIDPAQTNNQKPQEKVLPPLLPYQSNPDELIIPNEPQTPPDQKPQNEAKKSPGKAIAVGSAVSVALLVAGFLIVQGLPITSLLSLLPQTTNTRATQTIRSRAAEPSPTPVSVPDAEAILLHKLQLLTTTAQAIATPSGNVLISQTPYQFPSVALNWTPPVPPEGLTLVGYYITFSPTGDDPYRTGFFTSTPNYDVYNLVQGLSYVLRVQARIESGSHIYNVNLSPTASQTSGSKNLFTYVYQ